MKTFKELANPWVAELGIYEPGRPIEEVARELGFANADAIVKLASNENALGPSPRALEAMREAAGHMHLYPDGGAFYLKQALAAHLDVDPANLLPGTGSNELLELIGHAFLDAGTEIIMADRAFVVYRLVAAAARAATVTVPMDRFTHDLEAMADAVTERTRVVFVANPNNPTGTVVEPEAVERFMERISPDVIVCFDEAYVELLDPARRPDVLRYVRENRNVIVLRTFSKTYGLAGLRIGYAVAPPEAIAMLNRVRQPFNVNAMALAAATAALEDEVHVARTQTMVREGLRQLEEGLDRMGIPFVPSVANFLLAQTGRGREIFQALQRQGVIVRPMDGYGLPDYVRVTVGTAAENRRFLEALGRVLEKV